MEEKPSGLFIRRPWLIVVMVFVLLTTVWAVVFHLAAKNRAEKIPVPEQTTH